MEEKKRVKLPISFNSRGHMEENGRESDIKVTFSHGWSYPYLYSCQFTFSRYSLSTHFVHLFQRAKKNKDKDPNRKKGVWVCGSGGIWHGNGGDGWLVRVNLKLFLSL